MRTGSTKQKLASFVSQKGGVGKSALARLLAVGAARRGRSVLLADFDLEQLTCIEWNAIRLRTGVQPEIDARPFKSLKKLRKTEERFDLVIADTRGLADDLTKDVAEESDVVFLPTGTSGDDLRPTLALARRLAKHGGGAKLRVILSKVGRSERQAADAVRMIEEAGFRLLTNQWPLRDGLQSELDAGRVGSEARNARLREIGLTMEEALISCCFPPES